MRFTSLGLPRVFPFFFSFCLCLFTQLLFGGMAVVTYEEDTVTNFDNPERGDRNGKTLKRSYMDLESFVNTDVISQSWLQARESEFQAALRDGKKLIPRFHYMWNCEPQKEPPLDRILKHIDQLGPLLQKNSDLIALVEAGFIGLWGEWHYSGCTDQYGLRTLENRRKILFKLLSLLPKDRMVVVRYNWYKRDIFGTDVPLGPDSAFGGSDRARVGHQNDCFGYNSSDRGTYNGGTSGAEWQKNYLSLDNRYVPQEGETCGASSYSACGTAEKDLKRMHWDFISTGGLDGQWENGGCATKIHMHLGYRIALRNAALQDAVNPGGIFNGTINLQNVGWGKIYNPRGCELVFKNIVTQYTFAVKLSNDPRRWCMTDSLVSVNIQAPVPNNVPQGTYSVYLNLPDPSDRLRGRKQYSIRLANKNVWEDATGYNSLLHKVIITSDIISQTIDTEKKYGPVLKALKITRQGKTAVVSFNSETASQFTIDIFDFSGARIWSRTLPGSGPRNIEVEGLSSGMYFMKTVFPGNRSPGNRNMHKFYFME